MRVAQQKLKEKWEKKLETCLKQKITYMAEC